MTENHDAAASDKPRREKHVAITLRSDRGRRTLRVIVDHHLALDLSVSSKFVFAVILMCAAAAWYYWQM
ncbi:hypothetical protein [Streptomyces spongiicola]|uniref:hypothetical protein n=1 Tax=Streptomyces spongiicola TaxID=1690221 RepID=UPI0013A585E4|nr:hypothetical protein [Streptomyces spongiicola]